jgi:hypothetical protein
MSSRPAAPSTASRGVREPSPSGGLPSARMVDQHAAEHERNAVLERVRVEPVPTR